MELICKVDVVVPIYNAFTVLQSWLISLEANQRGINKIILINDASTDTRVKKLIENYSLKYNWRIINHQTNKGFVKTANEGLKISKNHTILLNSDTIVTKNWIKAFKRSISKNSRLGTATAWSNNAEICSFPKFLKNNIPPKSINKLSDIIYNKYKPHYPIIPTAVGFCMLITKKAKKSVGYFDENHFGHGYGEENDYSLRISQFGLTNILCDNAYVVHVGNESFRDMGLKPNEDTMNRLLIKHPQFNMIIKDYIEKDSLALVRNEIMALIKSEDINLYNELT